MTFANIDFLNLKEEKAYQCELSLSVHAAKILSMVSSAQGIFPLMHFEIVGSDLNYKLNLIGSNKEQLGLVIDYIKSLV